MADSSSYKKRKYNGDITNTKNIYVANKNEETFMNRLLENKNV